jgi:tetratricopeptide (TPR) repeat protein
MKLPDLIVAKLAEGKSLGFTADEPGRFHEYAGARWRLEFSEPLGYLPWNVLSSQGFDGDSYGFYWPIGRETADPVVCNFLHDYGEIVPVASDFAGCLRLLHSTYYVPDDSRQDEKGDPAPDDEEDEVRQVAQEFDVDLSRVTPTPMPKEGIPLFGAASAFDILKYDPASPYLLALAAEEKRQEGDLPEAMHHARRAIEAIPEYTDAWFVLAQAYRQQRDVAASIGAMLETFVSPLYFGEWDWRLKCLGWLQRFRDDQYPGCEDPIWKVRTQLTLATGVKWNDDYLRYEEAVEAYHALGEGLKAVRLRLLIGGLMRGETVSFRDRYQWSREIHFQKLRADCIRAGLVERARFFARTSEQAAGVPGGKLSPGP